MDKKDNCIFCGNVVEESEITEYECIYKKCSCCGRYIVPLSSALLFENTYFGNNKDTYNKDKLVKYLFYNKKDHRCAFISTQSAYDSYRKVNQKSEAFLVTAQMVEDWYPKTFAETIDKILLNLAQRSNYFGDPAHFSSAELSPMLFMKNVYCKGTEENLDTESELQFLLDYFIKNEYIVGYSEGIDLWSVVERIYELPNDDESLDLPSFTLSAKAWDRVYELQKNQANNKDVFVAMSFHESANDIRRAIKQAIDDAEYSSLLMDEIVHNHQIVPEMLRLIKESRFMIMDITQPNFGAYYEAGYAQGLGKEVIITCSQEVWDKKDFSCDKDTNCIYKQISTKPHFDIAQKQVLVWNDYADLTKKLSEWIKHLIG